MAEAELHKERLQMLAEKRKRQAEINDKRRQLDELILQLQRVKSKAMRDRWLMQGTPSLEDKSHRTQIEQDELSIKKLEDIVQRVESEIILLENEELRISEKEQFLRQRLQETEKSIEVLQMTLQNQEKGNEKARSVLLTAENGLYPTATAHSLDSLPIVLSNDDLTRERSHNTSKMQDWRRGLDSEAAQEILYADGVHEKNSSNKTCSPLITTFEDEGFRQSGHLSDTPLLFNNEETFGGNQTVIVEENSKTKPNGHTQVQRNNYTIIPDSPSIAIKKETRFELRPFHEEKKPSKLFDAPTEKEVRVVKVRPTEEIAELEKERLELIRGQAVKKNPSIAAKWWNPPQEKTLEEELDPEQLESHRRYEERKQRSMPQAICVQSSVQPGMEKTEVAYEKSECREPQLYSAEPLLGSPESFTNQERAVRFEPQHISCCPDDFVISTKEGLTQDEIKDDFTFVRAVMTMVKDEDIDLSQRFSNSSYHTNTSGLDDSSQSQDLTLLESLGNDSGIDNISDSGASNDTTNAYLDKVLEENLVPSTHKETTQTKEKQTCLEDQRQPFQQDDLTEDELQYHAGILIENVIHQALAHQNHDWKPCPVPHSPTKDEHIPNVQLQLQPIEIITPRPSYQSNVEDTVVHPIPVNNQTHSRSPLTGNERPEFSYFSKYTEAAELRSTADVTRPQEPEVNSGPFKLRSRKQRTLFMIEEEIRAAQEREEELKRQRQVNPQKVPCAQKMKNSNVTSKVVFTGKTAPGKIEKIRPPVSSCSSDGVCPSPPFDLSEDSEGGQRPKNFMQTLMDDYETHKVKRREKAEDNSVLEATRVTRRKSNMALRWEAGIYANQDFLENEEDVSEE